MLVEARDDANQDGESREPDWREWLDGWPRRLSHGKHYTGDARPLVRSARAAAVELGKVAVASRDSSGKYDYLWIQFVDGEVERGRPCPVCAATELQKIQKHFLRCTTCGSKLKALDDWEIEAGTFRPADSSREDDDGTAAGNDQGEAGTFPPADSSREDDDGTAAGNDQGEAAPERADEDSGRAGELAEILGGRVLSADGQEIESPAFWEDFLIEVTMRFLRPLDAVWPRLGLAVKDTHLVIRVRPPVPLQPSAPQTVDARVRVPAGLLVPRVYTVQMVLILIEDQDGGLPPVFLAHPDLLKIPVGRDRPGESMQPKTSPLDWELILRPDDPAEPGASEPAAEPGRT